MGKQILHCCWHSGCLNLAEEAWPPVGTAGDVHLVPHLRHTSHENMVFPDPGAPCTTMHFGLEPSLVLAMSLSCIGVLVFSTFCNVTMYYWISYILIWIVCALNAKDIDKVLHEDRRPLETHTFTFLVQFLQVADCGASLLWRGLGSLLVAGLLLGCDDRTECWTHVKHSLHDSSPGDDGLCSHSVSLLHSSFGSWWCCST